MNSGFWGGRPCVVSVSLDEELLLNRNVLGMTSGKMSEADILHSLSIAGITGLDDPGLHSAADSLGHARGVAVHGLPGSGFVCSGHAVRYGRIFGGVRSIDKVKGQYVPRKNLIVKRQHNRMQSQ